MVHPPQGRSFWTTQPVGEDVLESHRFSLTAGFAIVVAGCLTDLHSLRLERMAKQMKGNRRKRTGREKWRTSW